MVSAGGWVPPRMPMGPDVYRMLRHLCVHTNLWMQPQNKYVPQHWWAVHTCVCTCLCVRGYTHNTQEASVCTPLLMTSWRSVSRDPTSLLTGHLPTLLPCPSHSRWQVGDTEAQNEAGQATVPAKEPQVSSPVSDAHGLGSNPGSASYQPRELR